MDYSGNPAGLSPVRQKAIAVQIPQVLVMPSHHRTGWMGTQQWLASLSVWSSSMNTAPAGGWAGSKCYSASWNGGSHGSLSPVVASSVDNTAWICAIHSTSTSTEHFSPQREHWRWMFTANGPDSLAAVSNTVSTMSGYIAVLAISMIVITVQQASMSMALPYMSLGW